MILVYYLTDLPICYTTGELYAGLCVRPDVRRVGRQKPAATGNMTVRARLGVGICNTSRGCEGNEKRRSGGSMLWCICI